MTGNRIFHSIGNGIKKMRSPLKSAADTKIEFPSSIRIQSPQVTLVTCRSLMERKVPGGYFRFGDGDVNLLYGEDELLQEANPKLQYEMEETFSLSGEGIVKSLPLHSKRFGIFPGMRPGVHEVDDAWAERILERTYRYFIGMPIYSPIALHYTAVYDPDFAISFLRFLKSRRPIFIGPANVPKDIVYTLFDNDIYIKSYPIPQKIAGKINSYDIIDNLENEVNKVISRNDDEFHVVVVAQGCAGRPLAKRLLGSHRNLFLFDFGSLLDALCGWNTRAWIELEPSFKPGSILEQLQRA